MITPSTDVMNEITRKVKEYRDGSNEDPQKRCTIQYAIQEILEQYTFEYPEIRQDVYRRLCSRFGSSGAKVTRKKKRRQAFNKIQCNLFA